jgi:hypothetical protein
MRHLMMCAVVSLALLCAADVGLAKGNKGQRREQRKATQGDKEWRQKLKAMTPAQRRIAIVQKGFETDLATLRQMRKTAADEKATQTMAQIDKAIAAKEEQAKKMTAALERKKGGRKGEAATQNPTQGENKPEDKTPDKNDK